MSTIAVSVRLYGAFREYGEKIDLVVKAGIPVQDIKNAIAEKLGRQAAAMIGDSVIANENSILRDEFVIEKDTALSILPPVCGG